MKTKTRITKLVSCTATLLLSLNTVSAFSPSEVDGLKAWFDSDQGITLDEGKVTQWQDTTDNYTGTGITGVLPSYNSSATPSGKAALGFNGQAMNIGNAETGLSKAWSNQITFFTVISMNTIGNDVYIFDSKNGGSNSSGVFLRLLSNGNLLMRPISNSVSMDVIVQNAFTSENIGKYFVVMGLVTETGTTTLRVGDLSNTTTRALESIDIAGSHPFTLGRTSGSTSPMNGNIAALLVYDQALSNTDANAVYDYLYNQYVVIPEPATNILIAGIIAFVAVLVIRRYRTGKC